MTSVPGITVGFDGKRIINKEYRGVRLFRRLGNVSQGRCGATITE